MSACVGLIQLPCNSGTVASLDKCRIGNVLQASSDIDAIALDIAAIDDDIAKIDADPEFDSLLLWRFGIALGHTLQDINSAANCSDYARELSFSRAWF
jgi:hypothetical protein